MDAGVGCEFLVPHCMVIVEVAGHEDIWLGIVLGLKDVGLLACWGVYVNDLDRDVVDVYYNGLYL